ncbi:hypothetical protein A2971_03905 [Candidatus Gottesmanbacteria bacterium RIFCSPLOWO2_01_FULL_46_21]|uniref:Uncharacterized protein n=1 Tax=Candidatus Gottesmanbacteria bacterium RIFCSPLOWO2_01_FULL_46_21 TaxID=1798393 RepID=A0A1F6AXK1_9BACT|nr:MAG: hypothetical protein A2971_03905 [Candidatus Gottesmanbacteria bacterium RIFCSPLOWO2_01_FULL_46_21]
MTMKMSKRWPLIVLLVVAVLGVSLVRSKYQSFKMQQAQDQRIQEIKELTIAGSEDPKYRDHTAQSTKQLREKLCSLTARPAQEREKAVAAIRDFLEMPTAEVEYECNNAFYSLEEDKLIPAKGETYTVGMTYFVVDPATNNVLQVDETPGTWGYKTDGSRWFSDQKDYDYSANYSQKEVEQIAKGFIAKHPSAIGNIDLGKLTLETGKKESGNGRVNYFFIWRGEARTVQYNPPLETCSEDLDKDVDGLYYNDNGVPCIKVYESTETPSISIAFTSGGQLINYSNELNGPVSRATVR